MDNEKPPSPSDDLAVYQSLPQTTVPVNLTKSPESHKKSTNPYRKQNDASSPEFLQHTNPDADHSTGIRKHTPARAVFYDLPTAHSSITSGTARSKTRTLSNKNPNAPEEEDSIPLQDLDVSKQDNGSSFFEVLPQVPLPAVLSNQRHEGDHDSITDQEEDLSTVHLATPIPPSCLEAKPSVFESIKNAFVSISSPVQTQWPQSRQSSGDYDLEKSLGTEDGNQKFDWAEEYSNYHSSAGPVHYPHNRWSIHWIR